MSEIRATTISDETGNGPIALTKQSAAKAYVTFNGVNLTAAADLTGVDQSLNISSVVDITVGRGTVGLTNAMSDSYHCCTASAGDASSSAARNIMVNDGLANTTSTIRFHIENHSNTLGDAEYTGIITHGDLA